MLGEVKRAVLGNCWLHAQFSLVVQFGDSNRFTISDCRRIILRPQSSDCLLDLSRTKKADRPGRGGPCVSSECHHFRAVDAGAAQDESRSWLLPPQANPASAGPCAVKTG